MLRRHRYLMLPVCIFVLALGLRLFGIDNQSIWADEGGSIALSERAPGVILRETMHDVHPPLYFWVLHGWMLVWGASPVAARALSAVCGALVAAVTAALGQRWFGARAGIAVGIVAVCSPFAVHYSQEARMYALATLLAVLVWWATEWWLTRRTTWSLAIYCVAALALLATHYFAVAVVIAANVFVLACMAASRERLSRIAAWLAVQLGLAACFLTAVWVSQAGLVGWTATKSYLPPASIALDILRLFTVGPNTSAGIGAGQLLLLALAILGMVRVPRSPGDEAPVDRRLAALAWLVVPIGLMLAVSLRQPYYRARFLLPALPALHLLIGNGIAVLAALLSHRWHASRIAEITLAAGLVVIMAVSTPSLYREWFDPAYWRDDYRGAAAVVTATARSDDAIIYNGQSQIEAFDLYFHGAQRRFLVPRVRPIDPAATTIELQKIAGSHRRIYGLFYVLEESDPQGIIAGWLDENCFRAASRWFGGLQVIVWETGTIPAPPQALDSAFEGDLTLARAAFDTGPLRRGDAVRVQLEWQGAGVQRPLNVFAHLLDAQGNVVSQYDGPLSPGRPTRFAVLLPHDIPSGAYRLILGVYDGATGKRFATRSGADHIDLGIIQAE